MVVNINLLNRRTTSRRFLRKVFVLGGFVLTIRADLSVTQLMGNQKKEQPRDHCDA